LSKILVTGGCGFIGRQVVNSLSGAGHVVRVLDDLSYCAPPVFPEGVTFREGSVGNPDALRSAMDGVDQCVHLAGSPVLANPRSGPVGAMDQFLSAARQVFAAAADSRAKVVYASSAAVYGRNVESPISETAPPDPVNAHGIEKVALEQVAAEFSAERNVSSIGLRMFNVYGSGQSPASPYCGVVRLFAEKLLEGEPAVVRGDGSQARDFVYISDAVRAIAAAVAAPPGGTEVINICTGIPVSVTEVISILEAASGRTLDVAFEPDASPGVQSSVGLPDRARDRLGFQAAVDFETGVRALISELRDRGV